jgi:hypothetical protein
MRENKAVPYISYLNPSRATPPYSVCQIGITHRRGIYAPSRADSDTTFKNNFTFAFRYYDVEWEDAPAVFYL